MATIANITFKQILTDIANMPYYKNCSACSGLTTAPPNHEIAIEAVFLTHDMIKFHDMNF